MAELGSSGEELCDRVHHNPLLFFRHLRKHGKSQDVLAGILCLRECTLSVAQICERRLKMKWGRIIDFSGYAAGA